MKNSEQPAFATSSPSCSKYDGILQEGLTKREYFAGLAMQGLLVNFNKNDLYGNPNSSLIISKIAIKCADDLLKELDKQIE